MSIIGRDIQTGEYVDIPQSSRTPFYLIGAPGMGKSVLMEHLINDDIAASRAVAVFDFHFDLLQAVIARCPVNRVKDIVLLDITDSAYPFGLNRFTINNPHDPLAVSTASSLVMHIFKKLYGKGGIVVDDAWGVLLEELLRNATMTFLESSRDRVYTMAEIPLLLEEDTFRNSLVRGLNNRHVKNYWLNKYNRLSDKDQREERRSTLNRVSAFLTQPIVENIVGQSRSTIDFSRIITEKKILLVRLDNRLEDVSALIGAMLIAELLHTAYSQGDTHVSNRPTMSLYCDEFSRIAIEDFAILLSEGRKFGLDRIVLAHQFRDQLDRQNKAATLNMPGVAVFRVTPPDSQELAGLFDATPGQGEIIGFRPVLTPKFDIVDHLLNAGHTNEVVTSFVSTYVVAARDALEHAKAKKVDYITMPEKGFWAFPPAIYTADLRDALTSLNLLLFECMKDKEALNNPLPPLFLYCIAALFRFEKGVGKYDFKCVSTDPTVYQFDPSPEFLEYCQPSVFTKADTLKASRIAHVFSHSEKQKRLEQFDRCLDFIRAIRNAMAVLAHEPVLVDVGIHEPIYQLRTFQDRTNEIASQLANLPRYAAKVKLIGADGKPYEHTIKTISPDDPLSIGARVQPFQPTLDNHALAARIRAIKQQNIRDGWLKRREDVEQEIITRQNDLFGWSARYQQTIQDDDEE